MHEKSLIRPRVFDEVSFSFPPVTNSKGAEHV